MTTVRATIQGNYVSETHFYTVVLMFSAATCVLILTKLLYVTLHVGK